MKRKTVNVLSAIFVILGILALIPQSTWGQAKETIIPRKKLPAEAGEVAEKKGFLSKIFTPTSQLTIVPIPQSDPTLGTGLMLVAIYFYRQTEEQKRVQPPSSTQGFGLYTDSESHAFGIQQQSYWNADRWRFDGILAKGDFRLKFFGLGSEAGDRNTSLAWRLKGTLLHPKLLRRVTGNWYVGLQYQLFTTDSTFSTGFTLGDGPLEKIELGELDATSSGLGILVNRDTRDNRFNAYQGSILELDGIINDQAIGSNFDYEALKIRYRHYHPLRDDMVAALDARTCLKGGNVPFYDLCRLQLRGFPVTRYMEETLLSLQGEFRWRFYKRFGMVAFAGTGGVAPNLSDLSSDDFQLSLGAGLRFMVLESQRINLRVDYARGEGDDAWYISVAEAF